MPWPELAAKAGYRGGEEGSRGRAVGGDRSKEEDEQQKIGC